MLAHFSIAEKQKQQALGSQKAGWGRGWEGGIQKPVSSTRAQVAQLVSSSDHDNKICLQYSILSFKNSHSRPSPSFPPLAVQKAGPESCKPDPHSAFHHQQYRKLGLGAASQTLTQLFTTSSTESWAWELQGTGSLVGGPEDESGQKRFLSC